MNQNTLLADPSVIELDGFVSTGDSITIRIHSTQIKASCPLCRKMSGSVKGCYIQRISDLPWHNVAIRLELQARKFRCRNQFCPKNVFCERLPQVVSPYARRTVRLTEALSFLAFTLGGRGGAKVAARLNFSAVGKDKLLRLVRCRLSDEKPLVKVLGVDDFAFRKGCTYGTIEFGILIRDSSAL